MSWATSLQTAAFKGIEFDIQSVSDKGGRAVASHEYPYRNGTDAEDLGLHGDRFSVHAIFFGDDYEDRLNAFLAALRSPGAGMLMHPVFGEVKAALPTSWAVDHQSDAVDTAVVVVEFIDSQSVDAVFTAPSPLALADQVTASADTARTAADSGLAQFMGGPLLGAPLARLASFGGKLQQGITTMRRLLDITPLTAVLSNLDYLVYPMAYVADVRTIIDTALQGLPFGGRNSAYVVAGAAAINVVAGSGAADFAQVLSQVGPQSIAISTANDTIDPATSLADAAVVQAYLQVHGAAAVAEAAMIVLAGEASSPTLSRGDLEQLANQTRAGAQLAITAAHAAYAPEQSQAMAASLREVAYYVQEQAAAVIQQRPALGHRAAPVAGPLRLVAQALYGDPTRTTELAALNHLGRQPFIDRGQDLACYAN